MITNNHPEPPLFGAPLLPGSTSWVQQYFRLSRWLTIPVVFALIFALIFLWGKMPTFWLIFLVVLVPVNFVIFHYLIARVFAKMDVDRWHVHKFYIGETTLTIYHPSGKVETFPLEQLENIQIIYSGYERAFFPQSKYFSGSRNELNVKYRDRKVDLRFRLISPGHYQDFLDLLAFLYDAGIDFEEYNRTSGIPVKSTMLEL